MEKSISIKYTSHTRTHAQRVTNHLVKQREKIL